MKLWGSDDFCSGVMLTSSCSTFLNMKSAHNSHHQITKSPKSSNHIELRVLAKVMNISNPSANSAYYAFRATCHWKAKAEDYVQIVNIIQYEDKSVDRKKAHESTNASMHGCNVLNQQLHCWTSLGFSFDACDMHFDAFFLNVQCTMSVALQNPRTQLRHDISGAASTPRPRNRQSQFSFYIINTSTNFIIKH